MTTDFENDAFITSCFAVSYKEEEDDRWFSHFKELPEIDKLRHSDNPKEALSLCLKGLQNYPDSFLFYIRAADIYDDLGQSSNAEQVLHEGLEKSLSKCSLCTKLANRAFERKEYRTAIRWWIRAGLLQLESDIGVDPMPFLNLAYICQPFGFKEAEIWLLKLADRSSSQGSIRYNADGAELRHEAARELMRAGDDATQYAIQAFYERYNKSTNQLAQGEKMSDHDSAQDIHQLMEQLWDAYANLESQRMKELKAKIVKFGSSAVKPLLDFAMDDNSVHHRRQAAIALLAEINDDSVVDPLFNRFVKGLNPRELMNEDEEAFGLYREVVGALERMGYEIGS